MSNMGNAYLQCINDSACDLTVVVPVLNEEDGLLAFHVRLMAALGEAQVSHEILYVDDGSTDGTMVKLTELRHRFACTSIAKLSRNFGKESAMTAGL